jgi:hypothetical protein
MREPIIALLLAFGALCGCQDSHPRTRVASSAQEVSLSKQSPKVTPAPRNLKDQDLAATVIQSPILGGYSPLNDSEEELDKAAAFNSRLRLQHLMLHEVTNQELRVCYALQVLDSQIAALQPLASESKKRVKDRLATLLQQQTQLAEDLRAIQRGRADGGTPTKNRDALIARVCGHVTVLQLDTDRPVKSVRLVIDGKVVETQGYYSTRNGFQLAVIRRNSAKEIEAFFDVSGGGMGGYMKGAYRVRMEANLYENEYYGPGKNVPIPDWTTVYSLKQDYGMPAHPAYEMKVEIK